MRRFPLPLYGNDSANSYKQEKYVLTSPPDQLKTVISVNGDSIAHAVSYFYFIIELRIFLRILGLE